MTSIVRLIVGVVGGVFLAASLASAAGGPYDFYSTSPCRIVDTRNPTGPTGGPALAGQATRSFPITGGACSVPNAARAVVINVTVVGPTGSGHLRIFPYNTTMPLVSTLNFDAGEPAIANGAIVPLTNDPTANISVFLGTGAGTTANLVLDITGYFQ